ncbi:hypothetical protein F5Y09DRAFT_352326 [Xylaria sp. FL1042]|nr:hypothetical protein F5Y09DRAFT_352326 [Xylaria sp. FL1042]
MNFDLEELLAAPSCPSSPILQATPTLTPSRIRTPSSKKRATGDSHQRRRRLSALNRRQSLRSDISMYTDDRREKDDYVRLTHEPRSEFSSPTPKRNDHDPFQQTPSPRSPSSTPRRPHPRPVPSAPWSTRSAPARLEPSRTTGLTSSEDVDDKIIEALKARLTKSELSRDKVGNIYLFEVTPERDPDRTIMKIGHTTRTERHRMEQIKSQCKHSSMEREVDPQGMPIFLYHKAEALIRAHLGDRGYDFACLCRTTAHREYFDVDSATAQGVIRCWRAFCESDPYNANGELRPFWEQRLWRLKKLPYWDDGTNRGLSELESRRIRWEAFANPTQFEIFWFRATSALSRAWPWRLHIITVFQALIIAFFVHLHPYISGIGVLILAVCLLGEECLAYLGL